MPNGHSLRANVAVTDFWRLMSSYAQQIQFSIIIMLQKDFKKTLGFQSLLFLFLFVLCEHFVNLDNKKCYSWNSEVAQTSCVEGANSRE